MRNVILLLGIYASEALANVRNKAYSRMFTGALFTIINNNKQMSIRGKKKMWEMYLIEYYATVQKNEADQYIL